MAAIRTAARKKAGKSPRATIPTIKVATVAKSIRGAFPKIKALHLVGSRLRHRYGRDLDFVAVVDDLGDVPGRALTLQAGDTKINLFVSLPEEVETHILEFGLGFDIMRWKRAAIQKGLKLNRYGLWKNGVKVTGSMRKIAQLLGMPLKSHLVFSLRNPL